MRITLSVALSADGYIDDSSERRLVLSSPEDWEAVYRLRAENDAILIGGRTLRRDNPSLRIKDQGVREERVDAGREADIVKVVVSGSGNLDPRAKFFAGTGRKIVFTHRPCPKLEPLAEIIRTDAPITAYGIVSALEKRGINDLMVEGGAEILNMFISEGMADTVRIAVAPQIRVDDPEAPRLCESVERFVGQLAQWSENVSTVELGYMHVTTLQMHRDRLTQLEFDRRMLHRAIHLSRHSTPSPTSYRVGAVIVTSDGRQFEGYTHQTSPLNHAEEEAIARAEAAGASLAGATIYSSMEPCSKRASKPESCSALIIRKGFSRVVFALREPDCFVRCTGADDLRAAGIEVAEIGDMGQEVLDVNAHLRVGR